MAVHGLFVDFCGFSKLIEVSGVCSGPRSPRGARGSAAPCKNRGAEGVSEACGVFCSVSQSPQHEIRTAEAASSFPWLQSSPYRGLRSLNDIKCLWQKSMMSCFRGPNGLEAHKKSIKGVGQGRCHGFGHMSAVGEVLWNQQGDRA